MNTINEWHAFMIGFFFMTFLSTLAGWAYLRNDEDSAYEEVAILIVLAIFYIMFIFRVPSDIAIENFYSEPWYAMFGGMVGLILGIGLAHLIRKFTRKR